MVAQGLMLHQQFETRKKKRKKKVQGEPNI
jgi:hypothetical protein